MNKTLKIFNCILLFLFIGCDNGSLAGGTGAGNPPQADVTLAFKANSISPLQKSGLFKLSTTQIQNPDGTLSLKELTGRQIDLKEIKAQIQSIDISLPKDLSCLEIRNLVCTNNEASIKGPYEMNLITGVSTPAINFIKLPVGVYNSIGLQFQESTLIDPNSVQNYNLSIVGFMTAINNAKKPFVLRLNLKDGLDFQDSRGFKITSQFVNTLILNLKADEWFKGIPFSNCIDQMGSAPLAQDTLRLEGDDFCNGLGLDLRKNIEGSSEIKNEEQ